MLQLTAERAGLQDGDRILELGCGWGSQKRFIEALAAERGLKNLEVITCDVNQLWFPATTRFDRVVSVEMFEHMRNYESLMQNISGWLKPMGTLFVHIFVHKSHAYPFEVRDESQTGEHWLRNMDRHRAAIEPILAQAYGADQLRRWWVYWRVFFMSCAELWGYAGGRGWLVAHYLFRNRASPAAERQ